MFAIALVSDESVFSVAHLNHGSQLSLYQCTQAHNHRSQETLPQTFAVWRVLQYEVSLSEEVTFLPRPSHADSALNGPNPSNQWTMHQAAQHQDESSPETSEVSLPHQSITKSLRAPSSLSTPANIVVLGARSVGKTSIINRFINSTYSIKLQIWDPAGQERFRSISKLYYRGANAELLCYDMTDEGSLGETGIWMEELRANLGREVVVYVVGTKAGVVAEEPGRRRVIFERCIQYVSENLPERKAGGSGGGGNARSLFVSNSAPQTPGVDSRISGFWGSETGWVSCHDISANDGDGIEEIFRVLVRKLGEQQHQRERELQKQEPVKSGGADEQEAYFDRQIGKGSFRLGDKTRSWLPFPSTPGASTSGEGESQATASRCCGT